MARATSLTLASALFVTVGLAACNDEATGSSTPGGPDGGGATDGPPTSDTGSGYDGPNRPPVITSAAPTQLDIEIAADPAFSTIELTPMAVGSTSNNVFSTLPTADPKVFGFNGPDVRKVNFDTKPDGTAIPSGTKLTNEYTSLGVVMTNITVSNNVYGGPASSPNATSSPFMVGFEQRFDFTVPVVAVGVINTSPDQDTFEFLSPSGDVIFTTKDQADQPGPNYSVDRFVGARSNNDRLIGSMRIVNMAGQDELDELIFEVSSQQLARKELRYPVTATDPDGDTLTYRLIEAPAGVTVDATTGVLLWNPSNLEAGTHTFKLAVDDGRGGTAEQSFVLTITVTKKAA